MAETAALREAAAADRAKLRQAMRACVAGMGEAEAVGDVDRLSRIDLDFHYQFIACCPNGYLRGAYELIRYQLIALRFRALIPNCLDSHQVLVDAVERGDIEQACALLREHVFDNEERYRAACQLA